MGKIKKIFLYIFLFPVFCYGQNIITFTHITKAEKQENPGIYDFFDLQISPGYCDHSFIIELINIDKDSNKIILCNPKINVELIVHRTDYKRPDGKIMWDYNTEVKSNDTLTNDYLEIPNCSYKENLSCLVKVKSNGKYLLRIYYSSERYFEYLIENGEARWR